MPILGMFTLVVSACGAAPAKGPKRADPLLSADGPALLKRGLLFKRSGDFIRAEEYFKASMGKGMSPDVVVPHLVESAVHSNRFRMAMLYLKPVLAERPDHWPMRFLMANLHLGIGEPTEAEIEFERVIDLAPDEPAPHFALATLLADQYGRGDDARDHYLLFLDLEPRGPRAVEARRWLGEHESEAPDRPMRVSPPNTETEASR